MSRKVIFTRLCAGIFFFFLALNTLATSLEVTMTAKAKLTNNRKLIVSGQTNLPEGTNLSISFLDTITGTSGPSVHPVVTSEGNFISKPLGLDKGLPNGAYEISIITLFSQPGSIQEIIGQSGSKLSGGLVEDFIGKSVSYKFNMDIGPNESISKVKKEQKSWLERVLSQSAYLIAVGYEMHSVQGTQQCIDLMHQNQLKIKPLANEAAKLSSAYILLKTVPVRLTNCLSCKESSVTWCDDASEDYNNALSLSGT
jgi:hypothetical protein